MTTTQTIRTNPLAIAALVLGLVGAAFALLAPITGAIGMIVGLVGLGLAIPAVRAAIHGRGRKVMSLFGLGLSIVAIGIGGYGMYITDSALDELDRELQQIEQEYNRDVQQFEQQFGS